MDLEVKGADRADWQGECATREEQKSVGRPDHCRGWCVKLPFRKSQRDCGDNDHADGSELDTDAVVEDVPIKTAKAANKTGGGSLEKRLEAVSPST